jgi:hypothetical protein
MSGGPAALAVSDRRQLVLHADRACDALREVPDDVLLPCEVWDSLDLRGNEWLFQEEYCRICAERLPAWSAAIESVPWRRRRLVPIGAEARATAILLGQERP